MPAAPASMTECLPLVKNIFQSCGERTLNPTVGET